MFLFTPTVYENLHFLPTLLYKRENISYFPIYFQQNENIIFIALFYSFPS